MRPLGAAHNVTVKTQVPPPGSIPTLRQRLHGVGLRFRFGAKFQFEVRFRFTCWCLFYVCLHDTPKRNLSWS